MLARSRINVLKLVRCVWGAPVLQASSAAYAGAAGPVHQAQQRCFAAQAAEASTDADQLIAEGAKELDLDRVELNKLKERSAQALPTPEHTELYTDIPNRKKLTWGDIPAAEQTWESFHDANAPSTPVYDPHEWIATNYPEFGYSARSPFYLWLKWAEQNLPAEEVATYKAMDELMADDEQRSAVLKTAQFELARLWDWQHRRVELGLPYDVPDAGSSSNVGGGGGSGSSESSSSSSSDASDARAPGRAAASASGAARAAGSTHAGAAAPGGTADAAAQPAAAEGAAAAGAPTIAAAAAAAAAAANPFGNRPLSEVMAEQGAFQPGPVPGTQPPTASTATTTNEWQWAAARRLSPEEDEAAQLAKIEKRMSPRQLRAALASVERKRDEGHYMDKAGRRRELEAVLQQHHVMMSEDPDSVLVRAPLPPEEAAVAALPPLSPEVLEAQARGVATWGQLSLLDRSALRQAMLSEYMKAKAHKFKPPQPKWSLPDDGYTFDLNHRPPTATLQLLTDYLELKYADVLLKRDAVESLRRRTHALNLASLGSEAGELPPLALTRPMTLSAAERAAITKALDEAFEKDPGGSYVELVQQLYGDGLLTADEMAECCAAGQRRAAATVVGPGRASSEDRDRLFAAISGQEQQLQQQPQVDAATAEVARTAWEGAARKLQGSWADSVWPFADAATSQDPSTSGGSSSSSGSSTSKQQGTKGSSKGESSPEALGAAAAASADEGLAAAGPGSDPAAWQQPLSFEEAKQHWAQLVQAAAAAGGSGAAGAAGIPPLEEVLAADAAWRQGGTDLPNLRELYARLEPLRALFQNEQRPGRADIGSGEELQQLFALPPTLGDAIGQCLQKVARTNALFSKKSRGARGTSWEDLYHTLLRLQQRLQQQGQQQGQQGSSIQASGQQQGDGAAAAAAGAAGLAGATEVAEAHEAHLRELAVTPVTTPPYQGARRIVCFEQNLIIASDPSPRLQRKAALLVHAGELMQETGLSEAALQHIIRICGRRYNPATGDIRIVCDRLPSREENRRWCLQALHRLLAEGNAAHPSPAFIFGHQGAAGPSPFLEH